MEILKLSAPLAALPLHLSWDGPTHQAPTLHITHEPRMMPRLSFEQSKGVPWKAA